MKVTVYDGSNWFRRRLEKATFGQNIPRLLFHETFLDPTHQRIVVWDGGQHNERRRKLYPAYKSKRPPMLSSIRAGLDFFQELMVLSAATQIKVPTYEADDVIAAVVAGYAKRGLGVTVESTDWDLMATGAHIPNAVPSCEIKRGVPANLIHLFKTLCGDGSDTISGIPGFGKKSWPNLTAADKRTITALLEARDLPAIAASPIWSTMRGAKSWVPDHAAELLAMWDITGFLPIPEDQLVLGITPGKRDLDAGDALMKEFFL